MGVTIVGNYKLKYNFESNSQQVTYYIFRNFVGNYKLKYNFESNSQLALPPLTGENVGNYKLKYNFESNSQRKIVATKSEGRFSVVNWMFKITKDTK